MPQIAKGWVVCHIVALLFPPGRGLCPPGGQESTEKRASRARTCLVTSSLQDEGTEENVSLLAGKGG